MAKKTVQRGQQRGDTIGDSGIHHLPLPRLPRLQQCCQYAQQQVHATAAKIADQVERRHGARVFGADGVQGTGQGDVIQIVSRRLRQWSLLPPAGHAPVNQARVALQAGPRAQAQFLGDPGAKTFDQHIAAFDQVEHGLHARGLFQIDGDGTSPAAQHVGGCRPG